MRAQGPRQPVAHAHRHPQVPFPTLAQPPSATASTGSCARAGGVGPHLRGLEYTQLLCSPPPFAPAPLRARGAGQEGPTARPQRAGAARPETLAPVLGGGTEGRCLSGPGVSCHLSGLYAVESYRIRAILSQLTPAAMRRCVSVFAAGTPALDAPSRRESAAWTSGPPRANADSTDQGTVLEVKSGPCARVAAAGDGDEQRPRKMHPARPLGCRAAAGRQQ